MADFNPCFEKVINLEGGYVLHEVPGDRGGMTYAGIARNSWPKWPGWPKIEAGEIDGDLTEMVREFYRREFWDRIRGDEIQQQTAAFMIYDFAVNAGIKAAVRITQRLVEATPDGVLGPKTVGKLNNMLQDEKDTRLFVAYYSLLKVFRYKDICRNDSRRNKDQVRSNLKFLPGWINRVQKGMG